jgi:CHAT domain-containing protein
VRNEIAALTLRAAERGKEKARGEHLRRLWERHGELSKLIGHGVVGGGGAWADLGSVRKALAKDEALVEVLRLPVWNLSGRGEPWLPARYVAWVIPAEGEGAVRVVDLGPADVIDKAVRAFRADMSEVGERLIAGILKESVAEEKTRALLAAVARPVLGKLLPHLRGRTRLSVSPDGELWLVPWEALPLDERTYAVEKYRIRYLVSGRDLLAPESKFESGPALLMANPDFDLEAAEAAKETRRLLRGDVPGPVPGPTVRPSFGHLPRRWKALPGTAKEADAILPSLTRYAGGEPVVRRGREALEGVLRAASRPRVLVLSTHGFFLEPALRPPSQSAATAPSRPGVQELSTHDLLLEPRLWLRPKPATAAVDRAAGPSAFAEGLTLTIAATGEQIEFRDLALMMEHPALLSGLVLAGANSLSPGDASGADGYLTAWEIAGMDLRGTRLVVLSACDTGLGRVQEGLYYPASVVGLRQAFLLAGARQVVGTLWEVPDLITAELMEAYFRRLADREGEADALRNAQLKGIADRRAKKKAAHPYYWAAFTLTGQGK